MSYRRILQRGNFKLDSSIYIFNLPPGTTCIHNDECQKSCYALKSYRQYPNVRAAWNSNYKDLMERPEFLRRRILTELANSRTVKAVRIHSAGDFFSQKYIYFWQGIVELFPKIKFYAYTKTMGHDQFKPNFNFHGLKILPNMNLISSFIEGHLNFGSWDHCRHLGEVHGAFICPAWNKRVKCGRDCFYCLDKEGNRPCFIQH